jgi:hypothetical protein
VLDGRETPIFCASVRTFPGQSGAGREKLL